MYRYIVLISLQDISFVTFALNYVPDLINGIEKM
jgi:hypothetical protein